MTTRRVILILVALALVLAVSRQRRRGRAAGLLHLCGLSHREVWR